ncbi:hypothetical protein Gasu2_39630 [Galdieria sulphuraria]|nr:hypothetical protein Gasu2_39630 [Galdieria sulphuraria]
MTESLNDLLGSASTAVAFYLSSVESIGQQDSRLICCFEEDLGNSFHSHLTLPGHFGCPSYVVVDIPHFSKNSFFLVSPHCVKLLWGALWLLSRTCFVYLEPLFSF